MGLKNCPNCNLMLFDTDTECIYCGWKLEEAVVDTSLDETTQKQEVLLQEDAQSKEAPEIETLQENLSEETLPEKINDIRASFEKLMQNSETNVDNIINDANVDKADTIEDGIVGKADNIKNHIIEMEDTIFDIEDTIENDIVDKGDTVYDGIVVKGDTVYDGIVVKGDTVYGGIVVKGDTAYDGIVGKGDTVKNSITDIEDTIEDRIVNTNNNAAKENESSFTEQDYNNGIRYLGGKRFNLFEIIEKHGAANKVQIIREIREVTHTDLKDSVKLLDNSLDAYLKYKRSNPIKHEQINYIHHNTSQQTEPSEHIPVGKANNNIHRALAYNMIVRRGADRKVQIIDELMRSERISLSNATEVVESAIREYKANTQRH